MWVLKLHYLVASLVGYVITVASQKRFLASTTPQDFDYMWRLLIGLGCIPGVIGLYFRLTITETPRFTIDIERNLIQASADIDIAVGERRNLNAFDPDTPIQRLKVPRASWDDFRQYFSKRKNLKAIIGTSWSWFALDVRNFLWCICDKLIYLTPKVAFYGSNLNSSELLSKTGWGKYEDAQQILNLKNMCRANLILSAVGLILGFCLCFFFIDSWGRKRIQLMGFTALAIIYFILGTFPAF